MKPDGIFAIASITKTFTAALILKSVRDGKIDLDAPINTYGVDFPNGDKITVRQLLNHTSGIPPLGGDGGHDAYAAAFQQKILGDLSHHYTPSEIIAYVRDRPLLFPPGTSTAYSNVNAILAGQIVEHVTGTSLVSAFHTELLDPLKLASTHYAAAEPPPVKPIPGEFTLDDKGPVLNTGDFDSTSVLTSTGAAGAMVSDAADVVTWGNALLRDGSVLGADLTRQAHTLGSGDTGLGVVGFARNGICAASSCPTPTASTPFGHAGSLPGASSLLLYDPGSDTVIVIFTNREPVIGITGLAQDVLAQAANGGG